MKKPFFIFSLFISIATMVQAQGHTADETAIKQTIGRFGNSWAKADFSDMKEYMTPDVNWVNVVGMHWHNLAEVQYAHQAFSSSFLKNVPVKDLSTNIRFVRDDVAIVYWLTHVGAFYPPDGVNRGANKQGDKDNIATVVLIKQKGKWLISSAQNSDVVAQAAASNPVLYMDKNQKQ